MLEAAYCMAPACCLISESSKGGHLPCATAASEKVLHELLSREPVLLMGRAG